MRWLGHHIWDFICRIRNKIYMDHVETGTSTSYVVREADGQLKVRDRGTTVNTTGTPVANDFAKFTDADTIEGRSYGETKTDLSLNNVENTAISTWTGSTNVTTLGTIGTGTWNGTVIGVSKGGTGVATLTSNGVLTGGGTDAITSENNLKFDGSTLTVTGNIKYSGTCANVDSEGGDSVPTETGAKNVLVNDGGEIKQQTRANFLGNLSGQSAAAFSMNSQKITSVATPVASTDAATKGYIDGRKITDLTAPTSDVAMNSQKITGVATPTASTDAATKGYADRQTSRVTFVYANMKGASGTTETFIPLAGVPDEKTGFSNEQVVLIMPTGGYVKEIIIRAHYGTYTSENIVIKVYERPKDKKMNGSTQIGSDITVAAPTQNVTDDNNTRSTGDLGTSYPYTKGDALGISFTWQTTGPAAGSDKTYITVVIEENLSDLGY